jgi:hypothetical protein
VTAITSGARDGPQYDWTFSRSAPRKRFFAPSTARSQIEGKFMDDRPTFEETYRKYEFSELVRVGIALATWIVRMLRRAEAHRPDAPSAPAADSGLRAS